MHKHCTKKKNTYPNGTFETDIIKWHTSSLIHWDDYVNSTSYLSNSLFEKLDMFFFLTYTKNKSLGFFSFKKHTQHKEFLERKLQWWFLGSEKRIRRKGNSISFFLFHLLFVILPASISSNSQKVTFVQWATESSTAVQNKNGRPSLSPLSSFSSPSQPNHTEQVSCLAEWETNWFVIFKALFRFWIWISRDFFLQYASF